MLETTLTELRNHAKSYFDAIEEGETIRVYRNGRPIADIVPVKRAVPAWKKAAWNPALSGQLEPRQ